MSELRIGYARVSTVGQTLEVLWEERQGELGIMSGLTDNYLRVYTISEGELANTVAPVRLTRLQADGLWGETVSRTTAGALPCPSSTQA